jgi:hypothetical protein
MIVKLPSGTLGVRGTIVAGRVAGQSSLLVLLGEGRENDTGSPASALEACNAGVCKQVRRPGYGLKIDGPGFPPSEPFLVPLPEIDRLTQSVSDPAGYVETAASSGGGGTDVASEESGAVDGDTRSATEVSGRADASGMALAERAERRGGALDRLDKVTTDVPQDQNVEAIVPPVPPVPLEPGPDLATVVPPDPQPPGFDFLGLSGDITTLAQFEELRRAAIEETGPQSAVYERQGEGRVSLDDGGFYNIRLDVDFRQETAKIEVWNLSSPMLSLSNNQGFSDSTDVSADAQLAVGLFEGRITQPSSACSSGCDAFAAAVLLNGNERLADSAFHIVEIVPPSTSNKSPVMTTLTPENMSIPRLNP